MTENPENTWPGLTEAPPDSYTIVPSGDLLVAYRVYVTHGFLTTMYSARTAEGAKRIGDKKLARYSKIEDRRAKRAEKLK